MLKFAPLALAALVGLTACETLDAPVATPYVPPASPATALAEVRSRPNSFASYPRAGVTYLSFDLAHGFQISYLAPGGKSWLWYPGNRTVVPEEWKTDTLRNTRAICFRHPSNSRNPVLRTRGGGFACSPLVDSQKSKVASLKGDPFNLASGKVPYRLDRCTAPDAFTFDRSRFYCR